jgi:hypothetical protein
MLYRVKRLMIANNGNRMRVVPLVEVKEVIPQGWEYVASYLRARP